MPNSHPRAFDPRSFTLRTPDGARVLTVRVRPLWPVRLAVRAVKRASRATDGDGCDGPDPRVLARWP